MKAHKNIDHEGRRHICSKCGREFKSVSKMKDHESLCGTDSPKPFNCVCCPYSTTQKVRLTGKYDSHFIGPIK